MAEVKVTETKEKKKKPANRRDFNCKKEEEITILLNTDMVSTAFTAYIFLPTLSQKK
jgi:hypothetical protein